MNEQRKQNVFKTSGKTAGCLFENHQLTARKRMSKRQADDFLKLLLFNGVHR